MVILDTDLMSLMAWSEHPKAQRLVERLAALPLADSATTIISFEEFCRGWLSVLAKAKAAKDQIQTYGRLNKQLKLFCATQVLNFDEHAAIEFKRLKKIYPRLRTMDLKIASIVLARKAVLLSRNLSDFKQIKDIRVEDWTK